MTLFISSRCRGSMRLAYIGLWPPWTQLWELTFCAPLLLSDVSFMSLEAIMASRAASGPTVVFLRFSWNQLHCILSSILSLWYSTLSRYMYLQMLSYPVTMRPVISVYIIVCLTSTQGIAPTLIIFRVASGQGRPEVSSLETQSSLHFQTSRGSTMKQRQMEERRVRCREIREDCTRVIWFSRASLKP
ncbi:hypothetical protein ARMGADRAFT_321728 [Armillaria gallica]|uniref:Uncharacterized protein n=1 Tax=Armillaria gallica TaxID=47427 RepID=A0A2H3DNU4_ARMGA|nr:hypothetical protein ARMGADRAFT_321728 [Armillaria gallica]